MVPHDWLLLTEKQQAIIDVAAFSYGHNLPDLKLHAGFADAPPVEIAMPVIQGKKVTRELRLAAPVHGKSALMHVVITDGKREIWRKDIRTMLASRVTKWPRFGAVETKLRYDAPILTVDPRTGKRLEDTKYDTAWDPRLNDVVVFLPNGSRFVFWRGANYIPFWATRHNTGVLYQWAENCSKKMQVMQPDGTRDCPEPLFDSELRYGRVRIRESTQSRVHVRWDYQLTDVRYDAWGGAAGEDFYFYPDGFGTRVVTVTSARGEMYQLSEFIIMTPQAAYPLEVLPTNLIEVLPLDDKKESIEFPIKKPRVGRALPDITERRARPMMYRVFSHKEDSHAAIYFHPDSPAVPWGYPPLYDKGEIVTPAYWGNHWPLNRGKWTGWKINDLISESPAHNSVAAFSPPRDPETGDFQEGFEVKPLSSGVQLLPDARGRVRAVDLSRFVWMVAYTNLPDADLRDWGKSFSAPPALELRGGRLDLPAYSQERRALRIVAEGRQIEIKISPAERTINPVFEIDQAPTSVASVMVNHRKLSADEYAWDGHVLWIHAAIGMEGAWVKVQF
jgi:hypothetical protein